MFCCLVAVSCAPKKHIFYQLAPLPTEGICQVAVLFPINMTDNDGGGILFYRVFQSHLHQLPGLNVSQEGDVRKQYKDLLLLYGAELTYEEIRVIASRLGVQALILAEITRMDETDSENRLLPALAVTVKLINARTGTIIWYSHLSRTGEQYRKVMHFGLVNTMTQLVAVVTKEIIDSWQEKGFGKCIELEN